MPMDRGGTITHVSCPMSVMNLAREKEMSKDRFWKEERNKKKKSVVSFRGRARLQLNGPAPELDNSVVVAAKALNF